MENRIKNVMASVFGLPVDEIKSDASPDTIDNWDSLKHMNLVVALEEEFNINLDDEEIGEMLNYKLIEDIISNKII